MKTKISLILLGVTLLGAMARAAWVYHADLVTESALAYNKNYTLNMNTTPTAAGMDFLTAQAIYSSATIATASFTDGSVALGSITVASTSSLTAVAATNQITLAATSVLLAASATDYLTVLSTQSLASAVITLNGKVLRQGNEWTTGATTDLTAAAITSAVNAVYGFTATRASSVVTLNATPGANGNTATLSSNTGNITVGGALFVGGHNSRVASAEIIVRGQSLKQGRTWQAADTSSSTATNLAASINRISGIRAMAIGSVIYSTASTSGAAGNAFTLTSNAPSYLTVAGATYSGGRDSAYVRINGVTLTQGSAWTVGGTAALTAKAISDAIIANSSLNAVIVSTWDAGGVVSLTSKLKGSTRNYSLGTNISDSLTLSGAAMTGGTASAYALNGTVITLASHGLTTGLGVTFSTGTGVGLSPLVPGTVYYASKIDPNTLALATSQANAIAGTYVTLTSSSATGPNSFTLTPQAYTGTAGLRWFGSNDGSNYNPLGISSVTYSTPSGVASTIWDFGVAPNFKYLQLQAVAPTTGGLSLVVTMNGKN